MGRGGYDRNRRRRQRNILTVAIILVMAAIVVLSIMLIMEVTDCGKKPDDGIVNTDSKFADITFEDKLHASADLHKGDLILVKKAQTAKDGEVVVALTEDGNTLKRLFWEDGKPRLHAENRTYTGAKLDFYPKELTIQGIALKVIKDIR